MKKTLIISLIILIVLIISGFIIYKIMSPIGISSVNIPENAGSYSKAKTEPMSGYLVTGGGEQFIEKCRYSTYNPKPDLADLYVCKPKQKPETSLNTWISSERDFYVKPEPGAIKFSEGQEEIENLEVKKIIVSEENCGNPGYCTRYYWVQGRVIFSSNTKEVVIETIKSN